MIFMVLISAKLVYNATSGQVNWFFLVQSYLSTVIMFAGVYLLIHHRYPEAFMGLNPLEFEDQRRTFEWYIDFLHFSVGVMSAGISKVLPSLWYAELVVTTQMLISMVYWMFILGFGLEAASRAAPPALEEFEDTGGPDDHQLQELALK